MKVGWACIAWYCCESNGGKLNKDSATSTFTFLLPHFQPTVCAKCDLSRTCEQLAVGQVRQSSQHAHLKHRTGKSLVAREMHVIMRMKQLNSVGSDSGSSRWKGLFLTPVRAEGASASLCRPAVYALSAMNGPQWTNESTASITSSGTCFQSTPVKWHLQLESQQIREKMVSENETVPGPCSPSSSRGSCQTHAAARSLKEKRKGREIEHLQLSLCMYAQQSPAFRTCDSVKTVYAEAEAECVHSRQAKSQ